MQQWIAGISVTCFAASYLVAWLLEVARFFFRSGVRRAVMLSFVVAGFVAHTLYLGYRAAQATGSPLSSSFDWHLLAAWLLVAVLLYVLWYFPRAALGLLVLPLVAGLVTAAALLAQREPFAPRPASQVWGVVHGAFLLVGTVAMTVGFVAGLIYLWLAARLKRKLPPPVGLRLPSLELLERVNGRVVVASALLVAVGFGAGVVLSLVKSRLGQPVGWSDPTIWTSALMLVWLLAAAAFNACYRPARHGRKVAYLTVVNFGFLVVVLTVFLLTDAGHGGSAPPAPGSLPPAGGGG